MTAVSFDRYDTVWRDLKESESVIPEDAEDKYSLDECLLCSFPDNDSSATTRPIRANGYEPYVNDDDSNHSSGPATVPLCILNEVQLRFLCPNDLEEVRALCQDWFPIGRS